MITAPFLIGPLFLFAPLKSATSAPKKSVKQKAFDRFYDISGSTNRDMTAILHVSNSSDLTDKVVASLNKQDSLTGKEDPQKTIQMRIRTRLLNNPDKP
jgi:hypothetical protein